MSATLTAPVERSAWSGPRRVLPAAALAGACAVAALSPVGDSEGQVLCPYRLATGGWCPGCGCTRALSAVVRGDVGASLTLNPWTLMILAQAVVIVGWFAAAPERARAWWTRHDTAVLKANLAIGVMIWVVRLATGTIPL